MRKQHVTKTHKIYDLLTRVLCTHNRTNKSKDTDRHNRIWGCL